MFLNKHRVLSIHWRLTGESHLSIVTQNHTISKRCFVDTQNTMYCCLAPGHGNTGHDTARYVSDLINLVRPTGFVFEAGEM